MVFPLLLIFFQNQKKIYVIIRDLIKTLLTLYGIHELQWGINVFGKNLLASIFKWLQRENETIQNQNFYMKIYSHHPLYHIPSPKFQKDFFTAHESLGIPKLLALLIDRIYFRMLNHRVLFIGSSLIVFSLGSLAIGFSQGSQLYGLLWDAQWEIPLQGT